MSEDRKELAKIVRATAQQSPLFASFTAKCALEVAARAVERGRHLTPDEKRENLWKALTEEDHVPE